MHRLCRKNYLDMKFWAGFSSISLSLCFRKVDTNFWLRTKGVRIWIGASLVPHKKAGLRFLVSDFSIYKRMSWSGNSNWFTIGTKKTSELEPRKTPLKIKIDNASLSVRFYWIIGDLTKMWKTLIYGSHSLPRERP